MKRTNGLTNVRIKGIQINTSEVDIFYMFLFPTGNGTWPHITWIHGMRELLQVMKFPDGFSMQYSLPSMCLSMTLTCHMSAACMWGLWWNLLCPLRSWPMSENFVRKAHFKSMQWAWSCLKYNSIFLTNDTVNQGSEIINSVNSSYYLGKTNSEHS